MPRCFLAAVLACDSSSSGRGGGSGSGCNCFIGIGGSSGIGDSINSSIDICRSRLRQRMLLSSCGTATWMLPQRAEVHGGAAAAPVQQQLHQLQLPQSGCGSCTS